MNIYQCMKQAEDLGYDNTTFTAKFPIGGVQCFWLDAYMGLLQIPHIGEGFLTVGTIDRMFPDLVCYDLKVVE